NYGAALALAAHCYVMQQPGATTDIPAEERRKIIDLAQRAIRASANDPSALAGAANALASVGEDINASMALVGRALGINPSSGGGWYHSGWLRLWAGYCHLGETHFNRASRLSPFEMPTRALLGIGISQFFSHHLDEARATFLASLQHFPNWPPTYRF